MTMGKRCIVEASEDLQDFILLSRYRNRQPTEQTYAFCSYARIAKLLHLSTETIRKVCKEYFIHQNAISSPALVRNKSNLGMKLRGSKCFGKLTDFHIAGLCSQSTLQAQTGLTLEARAKLFNSSHPTVSISGSKLYQIYRANGITRKQIRQTKLLKPQKQLQTD